MPVVKAASHSTIVAPDTEKWVLIATIVASSMASIGASALNVALPALQRDLSVTGTELLWIINAYALFLSALILVGGSLGDHYGRKKVFMIGIIIFTVASLVCGLAPDKNVLIGARAVQGVGGALMVPGSLAILTASFPAERRGSAIGLWSTFSALMVAFGPVLGGWLASQGLWRVVFYLNIPLALIAVFALTQVPESKDETAPEQLDITGSLLATFGLAGITFAFIQASDFGFSDWRIITALVLGVGSIAAFLRLESQSDHPIVPLSLFKSRTFSGTNLMTLFLYAALGGALFFFPLNLIQVQGYPEQVAGLTLLPFVLLLTLMSRWAGRLSDQIGARIPLIIGPFLAGVGFLLFAVPGVTAGPTAYWWTFLPPILVMGIGMGMTVAPLTTAVMGSAPESGVGTASGINNAVSRSAGVLAVAIMGAVAIVSFRTALETRINRLDLPPAVQTALLDEAKNLGGATVPDTVSDATAVEVSMAIKRSFVSSFRIVMVIATGLCWLSAAVTVVMIKGSDSVQLKDKLPRLKFLFHDSGCPTCDPHGS